MADDLGYADLSCYGRRDYSTPNIDRLAAEGMKFLQAYANSAVCSATRTALITGRYQYRLPVGLAEPLATGNTNVGLPPDHPTLPSLLRQAGYGTTLLGKWHLGNLPNYSPLKSGYDHFWGFHNGGVDYFTHKPGVGPNSAVDLWDDDTPIEQTGYFTTLLGDRAVKTITDYAARTPAVPVEPPLQRAPLAVGRTRRRGRIAAHPSACGLRRRLAQNLRRDGWGVGQAGRPRAPDAGRHRRREQHHRDLHQR